MRNLHKYEELFPDEFDAEIKKCPIIYCAFGPVEYHGVHGALCMDTAKGYDICLRAAEISGGMVFPQVPIAPDGQPPENRDEIRSMADVSYPGVFTSIDICEKLYYELFEAFAEDIGFKVCVAIGSHGPAGTLVKKIAAAAPVLKGMKIVAAGSLTHNMDLVQSEYKRLGIPRISHGGMWEASMSMACNPEFVDPEKLKNTVLGAYEKHRIETYGPEVVPTYEEIKKVSLEFGEKLVQTAAERIAQEALDALSEMGI